YRGILFFTDPHLAATPPFERREGYMEHVLAKVEACLAHARESGLLPVLLGDFFHRHPGNVHRLLRRTFEVLGPYAGTSFRPWVLQGNHDQWEGGDSEDSSLAVCAQAGMVHLMDEPGVHGRFDMDGRRVVLGGTPWGRELPQSVDRGNADHVLWCTHCGMGFQDVTHKYPPLHEISGVDWVVNGHLHWVQPTEVRGMTRWSNIGGMTRISFAPRNRERIPTAAAWRPGCMDLEHWVIPHLPYDTVFPVRHFPP
ncbi:MAG: metallophosphoesterase, partial [Oceanidesulfovibrio sp.]